MQHAVRSEEEVAHQSTGGQVLAEAKVAAEKAAARAVEETAAALVKAPIPVGGLLVGSAFGAHYLEAAAREADALAAAGGDSSASYLLLSGVLIVLDVLFPIVFGRLLLVAMLEERNVRLARSITEAADRSRGNVVAICVEINQCVGCKSFLGDNAD